MSGQGERESVALQVVTGSAELELGDDAAALAGAQGEGERLALLVGNEGEGASVLVARPAAAGTETIEEAGRRPSPRRPAAGR